MIVMIVSYLLYYSWVWLDLVFSIQTSTAQESYIVEFEQQETKSVPV